MNLLNIIGLMLWVIIAFKSGNLFFKLDAHQELKHKILVLIILLLSGLNICRNFISVSLEMIQLPSLILLSYFYIGTSVFQLLLSYCVLESASELIKTKQEV